ncbi:unnamed protein product [Spirodela intermedia]|uniref:Uncharacterized protein n=1 Tax=Spirodela intermedia TaxID=51605 RepID=A0A7I8IS70_SPIIN|nr:unnamed protein product [Spirodela intermedia]CAA6660004.1 unnamed protein product [Spirodela intermedia]
MPKPSLKKLWGLAAHHRPDSKEKRMDLYPNPQIDELAQAYQDMQDMKDCYDSLLSAAAATANSAYEFSESLRELGTCLLEKTALNDDEETGEYSRKCCLIDIPIEHVRGAFRSHVTQTISTPSESLLNELRTVEEMKRQCDDKRVLYEHMVTTQREKGRLKNSKESFSPQQLQDAQQEYDEEATLFIFRLKSLKQGQSRSLLTQAVRHHSAQQLSFFRKGIKSLEAVEPHVKLIAEKQHIDYQFSGLEDYDTDSDNNDESVNDQHDANYDGELSFDYGQNEQGADVVSASRNSMELDQADHTSTAVSTMENAQENIDRSQPDSLSFRKPRPGSQSAPIFPEKKTDSTERIKEMSSSSTKRFHTYVLPTPIDLRSSTSPSPGNTAPAPSKQSSGPFCRRQSSSLCSKDLISVADASGDFFTARETHVLDKSLAGLHCIGTRSASRERQSFARSVIDCFEIM